MPRMILQGEAERRRGIHYEMDTNAQPLGEGGMGIVYEGICVDEQTGATRPVAIKFMYDDLPAQVYERARREASIQLHNDNLIEMLGFLETKTPDALGTVKTHYHVVSELLDGVSLSDLLEGKVKDRNGQDVGYALKLQHDFRNDPEHFARTIVISVLSGLMALHDAGYIHRDIAPSNIFITADGRVKLIDFGIAKQMNALTTGDKQLTVAGKFMGRPEYAAPELALGDVSHQNQTTDIYAMGILLYECIVGHTPFEGARHEILERQIREKLPLQVIRNKELRRIIATACDKKQENRYQSAAQMRVALELTRGGQASRPSQWPLWLAAGGGGAALLAAVIVGVLYLTDRPADFDTPVSTSSIQTLADTSGATADAAEASTATAEDETADGTVDATEPDSGSLVPPPPMVDPSKFEVEILEEVDADEPEPEKPKTKEKTTPQEKDDDQKATEPAPPSSGPGFKLEIQQKAETTETNLVVTPGTLNFKKRDSDESDSKQVTVKSNKDWTVKSKPDWIQVITLQDKFLVVPQKNTTGADRSGTIIVRSGDKQARVIVNQKG